MDKKQYEEEELSMLKIVFKDGVILKEYMLDEIRKRVRYEKVF
jgi:hypothetical protein